MLENKSLRALIAEAEALLLLGPHPERARLDAETLLLHATGQDRAWLFAHSSEVASLEIAQAYATLMARRRQGEPIQYITGHAEFFGLPFSVAPGVLIPRPETEHLVEEVIRLAAGFDHPQIADIGTGSGAIAVALAHALPKTQITATDMSPDALKIARENIAKNHVAARIAFLEGDLLAPLAGRQFHIITSNPPYIPFTDHGSLSIEVREHEPHGALFAGKDGLDIYRRLIPGAYPLLATNGFLVLEIGYGQRDAIKALLKASNFSNIRFVSDYQDIPRVAIGRRN